MEKKREVYSLKINRNIPMSFVLRLKADLARSDVWLVRYAMQPSVYETGTTFRTYDDWAMLGEQIPEYYAGSPDRFKAAWRSLPFSNIIDIRSCNCGTYLVDERQVGKGDLKAVLKTSVGKNTDYMIRYYIRGEESFQDYMDVVVAVRQAIEALRSEYRIEHYGREYYYAMPAEEEEVRKAYPVRIFEVPEGPCT